MGELLTARLSRIDLVGIIFLGLWGSWVAARAIHHNSHSWEVLPYLTAPVFAVLGLVASRHFRGRLLPEWFATFLLALSAYVLISVTVLGGAGGGPLGYANANAALAIQLTAIACITALRTVGQARTWALWAMALYALSVPFTRSQAGVALLLALLPALALALTRPRKRRIWAVPTSVLVVLAATAVVIYIARMQEWSSTFLKAFSGTRQQLWSDAISLWAHHPITGGGPGAFAAYSRIADDSDTERVHMSLLQVGSELGMIGLALFGALVLTVYVKLALSESATRLVATAALTALLIHSFVDHLFEFPAITLAMGMVVGLASYSRLGAK